jgi:SAM-dependent methyltransferase
LTCFPAHAKLREMSHSEDALPSGPGPLQVKPLVPPCEEPSQTGARDFTHVGNFTGYMGVAFRLLDQGKHGQKTLDIPAGNGLFAERLRERGHTVVCADINREKPDYVLADMNERLPFADAEFDSVVCMEGLEHTLDPAALIGELCRVVGPGGRIILTVPNIHSLFSRLKFLCTGSFYQFSPWGSVPRAHGEKKDRGHISSFSYHQLRYLFDYNGAQLVTVAGDRWKKKWLIPFLLPALAVGWLWMRLELGRQRMVPEASGRGMLRDLFSAPALFSRSLVLVFQKGGD